MAVLRWEGEPAGSAVDLGATRSPGVGEARAESVFGSHPYLVVAGLSGVVWVVFGVLSRLGPGLAREAALLPLDMTVAVTGILLGFCYLLYSRLADQPAWRWLGAAMLVYAGLASLYQALLEAFRPGAVGGKGFEQLWIGCLAVVGTLVLVALLESPSGTPLVPRHVAASTVIGLVAVPVVLFGIAGASATAGLLGASPTAATHALGGAMWVVLAAMCALRARRQRSYLLAWTTAMMIGLAEAGFAQALGGSDTVWLTASALLRLAAMLVPLLGILAQTEGIFAEQRDLLRRSVAAVDLMTAQRSDDRRTERTRIHDQRSALLAMEIAAGTLEHHFETLEATVREELTRSLGAEITRLQLMIGQEAPMQAFRVEEALRPLLCLERLRGTRLRVQLPADLRAFGAPYQTAEAVQNLLDNARVHAPGAGVTVRGHAEGDWVVLRVEDDGPGIPRHERHLIFEAGGRGRASAGTPGEGLGLYVARRLLRRQGGDLWVEKGAGVGACFAMQLVAFPAAQAPRPGGIAAHSRNGARVG